MLTSYLVTCPHCRWFGSLLPCPDVHAVPQLKRVVFECPHCQGQWQARLVGDDVVALSPEPAVAEKV